jgi:hypothetical protein
VAGCLVQLRAQKQAVQVHNASREHYDAWKLDADCVHAPVHEADEQRGSQRASEDWQVSCDQCEVVQH